MATSAADAPTPSPPPQAAQHDRYIAVQLKKTRAYVKAADFFSALMTLLAGIFLFLLAVVVIDAWLIELNLWARMAALGLLVAGSIAYFATTMLPLLVRRINPAYAALAIEKSEPSLKNSLINFLSFRARRDAVHDVVYQALQQQAASDLSHAPLDAAIDRNRLLKMGYLLAGVVVVCGLYTILSPKKPFSTLGRIVAPFAEIDRPSIVKIKDVDPGDADVFDGQQMRVTAEVAGLADDDPVTLIFSTADGRRVDVEVPMTIADDGFRRTCLLPPDESGVRQDLRYHIEAGDARTRQFNVKMIPAPIITVRSLEYDYPSYTRQANLVVEDQGDIKALEGTRVTVRARANQPIKHAFVEFDPHLSGSDRKRHHKPLSMTSDGMEARGSFVLELEEDGLTPKRASYQVRFTTEGGHASQNPTIHNIEVTRDLKPEIEILTPKSTLVKVPVNGRQQIEIRAIDPDYGVSEIRLHATVGGEIVLNGKTLIKDAAGRTGQVIANYELLPAALGLVPGDTVFYWAEVEDNRTSPIGGSPAPNSNRTANYQIEIVAGKAGSAVRPKDKPEPADKDDASAKPADDKGSGKPEMGESGKTGDESTGGEKGETESGEAGKTEEGKTEEGGASGGQGQSGGESSSGKSDRNEEGGAGQSGSASPEDGETGDANSEGGKSGGSGQQGGEVSSQGGEAGDESRSEPLHDGEVFERAIEHQRRKQSQGGKGGGKAGDPQRTAAGGKNEPAEGGGAQPKNGGENAQNSSNDGAGGKSPSQQQQDKSNNAGGSGEKPQQDSPSAAQNSGKGESGDKPPAGQSAGDDAGNESAGNKGAEDKGAGTDPQQQDQPSQSGGPQGSGKTEPNKQDGASGGESSQGGMSKKESDDEGKQQSGGGSPEAQGRNQERKQQQSGGGGGQENEAQSPSNSQKQSNSQDGDDGGDKSGGSSQGGGQEGQQPGTGSSGSSNPADQGENSGKQPGKGETTDQAGDQAKSAGKTGSSSGDKPGGGSEAGSASGGGQPQADQEKQDQQQQDKPMGDDAERPSDDGAKAGDTLKTDTDRKAGGEPSGDDSRARSGSSQPSDSSKGGGSTSGGTGGAGGPPPRESGGDEDLPPADKANLEYARKATDLALEYLKDQRDAPDPELLDKLDMSKEELQKFIDRWSKMKRSAGDEAVRDDYDDALRSLGLRPAADKRRNADFQSDTQRGPDSGSRSKPPPSFIDKFRAFKNRAPSSDRE